MNNQKYDVISAKNLLQILGIVVIVSVLMAPIRSIVGHETNRRQLAEATKRQEQKKNDQALAAARMAEAIKRRDLVIGMNQDQVMASIGYPEDKSKTTSAFGTAEIWTYRSGRKFVTFRDGLLASWTE